MNLKLPDIIYITSHCVIECMYVHVSDRSRISKIFCSGKWGYGFAEQRYSEGQGNSYYTGVHKTKLSGNVLKMGRIQFGRFLW